MEHALTGTSVLSSRFRTFREVVDDDALADNPIVGRVDQPRIGRYLAIGSPLRFEDRRQAPRPAPALGADTDTVLVELLGLGADELAALHRDAVVGSSALPAPAPG